MNRSGAIGLGATVGELRAALDKLPADMAIVVRGPDGVAGAIWNSGPDTGCDEHIDGTVIEFFAIEVSDEPDFVRAEDDRRRGSVLVSPPTIDHPPPECETCLGGGLISGWGLGEMKKCPDCNGTGIQP